MQSKFRYNGHSVPSVNNLYLILIIIISFLIVGHEVVKSIHMGIHGGLSCGSEAGVKVELRAKSIQCITEPYGPFSAGYTLDWKEELLGNCKTTHFDPMEEKISLLIKTNIDDSFCPILVKIILNDQKSTSYLLSLPDGDWHNYDNKDDITYTAEKILGKI